MFLKEDFSKDYLSDNDSDSNDFSLEELNQKKFNSNKSEEKTRYLINEEIKFPKILVIRENEKPQEFSISEALIKAKESRLDLVLINDKANPPVVKMLDYGRFLYQIKRKSKGARKNIVKIKSITIKPQISEHDIEWKSNQAIEWFKSGDRVQFVVRAAGRMSSRIDLINEVFRKFSELVADYGQPREDLKKVSKIQYVTYFFPNKK